MPQAASSERLTARAFGRQTAELQIRAALLNRITQLGTPETTGLAQADRDQGQLTLRPIPSAKPHRISLSSRTYNMHRLTR